MIMEAILFVSGLIYIFIRLWFNSKNVTSHFKASMWNTFLPTSSLHVIPVRKMTYCEGIANGMLVASVRKTGLYCGPEQWCLVIISSWCGLWLAVLEEVFCFFRSHALCEKEALPRSCGIVALLTVKVLSSLVDTLIFKMNIGRG